MIPVTSALQGGIVSPEWAWAWPANRRILYNRASADLQGRPWSERKRYVWWDEREEKWTGYDVPDFPVTKRPDYQAAPDTTGMDAISGSDPFIMMADGRGWLYSPSGLLDGPLPTFYEPLESPIPNLLYPAIDGNPAAIRWRRPENPYHATGDPRYPIVATTFRLTEHHTAGGMSRTVPWLVELQPEMFAEIDPQLAADRGIEDGGWMTIVTERAEIEARAKVTERIRPVRVDGRVIHQIALPWHWGYSGLSTGDTANELVALSGDPNVSIQDDKAFTCDVRAGRRYGASTARLAGVGLVGHHVRPNEDDPSAENPAEWPGGHSAGSRLRRTPGVGEIREHERPGHRDCRPPVRRPAHGLLHRHLGVHRLQGLRGRVQTVERPARRRLADRQGRLLRPHRGSLGLIVAPRPVCRAVRALAPAPRGGAARARRGSWRQAAGDPGRGRIDLVDAAQPAPGVVDVAEAVGKMGDWVFMSDVCKHCTNAGCLDACPTGALIRTEYQTVVLQPDVCNGCGYCVPACPFGVVDRDHVDGRAGKCTLCYDRLEDGLEPACAKSCPTDSIQFGPHEELVEIASRRVAELHGRGIEGAYLYGAGDEPEDQLAGGLGAFFLLTEPPERYGLPAHADSPVQENVVPATAAAVAAGLLASAGTILAFAAAARRGRKKGVRSSW